MKRKQKPRKHVIVLSFPIAGGTKNDSSEPILYSESNTECNQYSLIHKTNDNCERLHLMSHSGTTV